MNDGPAAAGIVAAVIGWLDAGAPDAGGFQGKVAASALAIVARELEHGPSAEAEAIERLRTITGATGSFDKLESTLCTLIDRGGIAPDDPALLHHLRQTARDRLAIDQPRYRSLLATP
ncbi:DUF6285 domain-containing protein [Sphingomonas sp.]|uniref:DUF6285 domain-containing protein n=1 Tax=Sphingomonas sp. TaxID=28214 RepID=UPI003CC54302